MEPLQNQILACGWPVREITVSLSRVTDTLHPTPHPPPSPFKRPFKCNTSNDLQGPRWPWMGVSLSAAASLFNTGNNEPPPGAKERLQVDPAVTNDTPIRPAGGCRNVQDYRPSALWVCVCASVGALTQSVPTQWPQRGARHPLRPLIIQRAHSFPL